MCDSLLYCYWEVNKWPQRTRNLWLLDRRDWLGNIRRHWWLQLFVQLPQCLVLPLPEETNCVSQNIDSNVIEYLNSGEKSWGTDILIKSKNDKRNGVNFNIYVFMTNSDIKNVDLGTHCLNKTIFKMPSAENGKRQKWNFRYLKFHLLWIYNSYPKM